MSAAIFVNDSLGKFPGTLPMSDVRLIGAARTPRPSIYVSFRSFAGGCANELQCAVGVSDTGGSPARAVMAASAGRRPAISWPPSGRISKRAMPTPRPISNADIAPTLAQAAGIDLGAQGQAPGPGDQ